MPLAFLYLMLAHCPTVIVLTFTLVTATMFHVPACELLGCHDLITGAVAVTDVLNNAVPVANDLLHAIAPGASDVLRDIAPAVNDAAYNIAPTADSAINRYTPLTPEQHTLYLQICLMKYYYVDVANIRRRGLRNARRRLYELRGRRIRRAQRDYIL